MLGSVPSVGVLFWQHEFRCSVHIVSKRLQWSTARAAAIGGDALEAPKPRCYWKNDLVILWFQNWNLLQMTYDLLVHVEQQLYMYIYIHEIFVIYTCMCIHKLISPWHHHIFVCPTRSRSIAPTSPTSPTSPVLRRNPKQLIKIRSVAGTPETWVKKES